MPNLIIQNTLLTLQIQELKQQILELQVQIQKDHNEQTSINEGKQTRLHWNFYQDQLLLHLVMQFGFKNCKSIATEIKCRSEKQVYFRLRYLLELFTKNNCSQKLSLEWRQFLVNCKSIQM
ncbi:SANT/Myb_domain [Hexamita inflata]|uniref:SANT/Myb domain n=1 Tax=Hexamita inflata TaxID=28002 RepID=A0AA86V2U5_9EUKA|nr:SANT/Myb domain [Hexamita inflata]